MEKILIALRSEAMTNTLENALKTRFQVYTCHSAEDALSLLEARQPEVLILDLRLPPWNGLTLLRQSSYKPPAVLALTDFLSDEVMREAAAAGVQDMVRMPFTLHYLLNRLDLLLNKENPSPDG